MKSQKIPRSSSAAVALRQRSSSAAVALKQRSGSAAAAQSDVIIVGAGLAGLAQALLLRDAGFDVVLLEAAPLPELGKANYDLRTTALSFASKMILERTGLWAQLAPDASPIHDIRIADGDAQGYLHFSADEVGADAFGWIVENYRLRAVMTHELQRSKSVRIIAPARVTALDYGATDIAVTLSDQTRLHAKLVIAADGRNSFVREWAGIKTIGHDYKTSAVVCNLCHEKDHHQHAIEHFMPNGPFAVLPMRSSSAAVAQSKSKNKFHSSLVWSETPEHAQALVEMDEADFNVLLHQHMPHYGKIGAAGPRRAYPLKLQHAMRYYAPRIALISETVHAMHPIAGQGLNVGMRDVAVLADLLTQSRSLGLDIGAETLLARYGAMRLPDSAMMSLATHGLDRLFSNDYASVAALRRAGLQMVGKILPLKKFFMRYAMGLTHRPVHHPTHHIAA